MPEPIFRTARLVGAWRHDVLWLEGVGGGVIDGAQAREHVALVGRIAAERGGKLKVVLDSRQTSQHEREARLVYAGPELAACIERMAVIIGSPLGRLLGAIYTTFHPPGFAQKVCTSEAEALAFVLADGR